jgi:glycosyltransferase involved in cell wall biosynthesis
MKIAFLYGPWCLGNRPIDFAHLWDSERGLTGSELSFVMYASAMATRGHDVTMYVPGVSFGTTLGCTLKPFDRWAQDSQGWDAVCAWNEPDLLRGCSAKVRLLNQQLNDFQYCQPGFEEFVDVFTSPSQNHLGYLKGMIPNKRWEVLPNGCDPDQYTLTKKISGRVIWASSADRGLHHLLQMWPIVKKEVPWATLHCFYRFSYDHVEQYHEGNRFVSIDIIEIARRARYIKYAVEQLKAFDVTHHGGVSRKQMVEEFNLAQVLAYPCDTIRYTEGFSVTTLEACASGTVPVITPMDALPSIYGESGAIVAQLEHYVEALILLLKDRAARNEQIVRVREFAKKFDWDLLAIDLESLLCP